MVDPWIHTVTAPTPKAQTSVRDVTVMATPAFLIVCPILSGKERVDFCSSLKLFRHCMITNMSSIPIPVTKTKEDNELYSKQVSLVNLTNYV